MMKSGLPTITLRSIGLLLGTVIALLIGAEVLARRIVIPASRIERRVMAEFAGVRDFNGPNTVLVAGNSLLLYGIRDSVLPQLMPPGWSARRLAVEQTAAIDWKYGLRKLYRENTRPAVVALALDPGQLTSNLTRTDYSAMRMVSTGDVIAMGREANLHPTEISRLVLSNLSAFYGFRAESRKVLLGRLIPGMDRLMTMIVPKPPEFSDSLRLEREATARLRTLAAGIASNGARLVFVLPPRLNADIDARAVARAARAAGVPIITPDLTIPYDTADFFDGYHLSDKGATRFEREFQTALRPLLTPP
jgi:hypothetical protein